MVDFNCETEEAMSGNLDDMKVSVTSVGGEKPPDSIAELDLTAKT